MQKFTKYPIDASIPAKVDPYQKTFIVRDRSTGYPIENQEYMTLREAVRRVSQEVEKAKRFNLGYINESDFEVYDTKTMEIVL